MQALLLSAALLSGSVHAASPSEGSLLLSVASGFVVAGSMATVAGSGEVVVKGVKAVGESTEVVLTNVADGASATVRLSGEAAKGLSTAVGNTVQATAMSTGYMLVASGKAIAFIPNEIGTALLHHSKVE
jgi:hypothetical protein